MRSEPRLEEPATLQKAGEVEHKEKEMKVKIRSLETKLEMAREAAAVDEVNTNHADSTEYPRKCDVGDW